MAQVSRQRFAQHFDGRLANDANGICPRIAPNPQTAWDAWP